MKLLVRGVLALLAGLMLLNGCHKTVRTDLETLRENPDKFQGKEVVIVTEIEDVKRNPQPYLQKEVQLQGQVEYMGFREHFRWNFLLKDAEGRALRCYEREYAYRVSSRVELTVREAEKEGEPLTVVGSLENGNELELDWIEYRGDRIDTDFVPHRELHRFWIF